MATHKVLVIGGGVAGISAALSLAKRGFNVFLIEREDYLGGRAASYGCKADEVCLGCGVCASEDKLEEISRQDRVFILTGAQVAGLEGDAGRFTVEVVQKPRWIDPEKCTACGLCAKACPNAAINPAPQTGHPQIYSIDGSACMGLRGLCDVCAKACPFSAINLETSHKRTVLEVAGIIVATGFDPFDARTLPELGYGRLPGVMTGEDVEEILRASTIEAVSRIKGPRVAFVQCVGSRNVQLGRNYCSEVCCKYALRMASSLMSLVPDLDISVFYMDLQTAGKSFPETYKRIAKRTRLVQGVPVEVQPGSDSRLKMKYEDVWNATVKIEEFDTVILSIGVWPRHDSGELAGVLGINTDEFGFFGKTNPATPYTTNRRGIITAGACQKPFGLVESIASGEGAAREMASLLGADGR